MCSVTGSYHGLLKRALATAEERGERPQRLNHPVEAGQRDLPHRGDPARTSEFVTWVLNRFVPPMTSPCNCSSGDPPRVTAQRSVQDLLGIDPEQDSITSLMDKLQVCAPL